MTVVYIDVLFLLNLLINYLLLYASARFIGVSVKRLRIAAGAFLGAAYSVLWFFPELGVIFSAICKLTVSVAMILISFGAKSVSRTVRLSAAFYASSLVLAGSVMLIAGGSSVKNGVLYIDISLKTLLAASCMCIVISGAVFRGAGRLAHLRADSAEIRASIEGKEIQLRAMRDTGCIASDPLSGLPLVICRANALAPLIGSDAAGIISSSGSAEEAFEKMSITQYAHRFTLIPVNTVSSGSALILAFRPDSLTVDGKRGRGLLAVSARGTTITEGFDAITGLTV